MRGGGSSAARRSSSSKRRQEQWAAAARTGLGALVKQAFGIEFAEPVQGEGWPGAVTQQALAPRAVSGLDAHRRVDGKATAVFPLPHRPCVIAWQQAAPHEAAQQAPAYAFLHLGEKRSHRARSRHGR